ncbi:MAG: hypothetical protein QF486_00735 [Candidatus Woesearchaeota archaeon]|jgi:hypothetical protein|nr:hypothetical protein [Candidatus Woesearchaeota archaeon]MDP7181254.1 hypothetical protein [Candidatus Woesearchaeota archaeon]MDP7198127.1 hypothetical protein [Candidatus Woesearchaeota archaeon]MDP7466961.1 hypothetical protein [Candidatus Woesearchaeota archaeon]MDP7646953.1 hypothetical protein [Candidatus Woesearchaeota archaeon]
MDWQAVFECVAQLQTLPHKTKEDLAIIKEKVDDLITLLSQDDTGSGESLNRTAIDFQTYLGHLLESNYGVFQKMGVRRMLKQLGRRVTELNAMSKREFLRTAAAAAMAPYIKLPQNKKTIGHQILDIEAPLHNGKTPQKAYDRLDEFIKRVGKELKNYPEKYHKSPKHMLTNIHRCIKMEGYTNIESQDFFSVGLITKRKDCDVGSMLFISAAQVYGFPIRAVMMPGHLFVTWGDTLDICWETTTSFSKAMETKESQLRSYRQSTNLLRSKTYMRALSNDELLSYYHANVANKIINEEERLPLADEYSKKSIELGPNMIQSHMVRLNVMHRHYKKDIAHRPELITTYKKALALDQASVDPQTRGLHHNLAIVLTYRIAWSNAKKIDFEEMKTRAQAAPMKDEFVEAKKHMKASSPISKDGWQEMFIIAGVLGDTTGARQAIRHLRGVNMGEFKFWVAS